MSNDKWAMFKQYMHNELGITKEDIRGWIEEAVQKEAERLVAKTFNDFDVHRIVMRTISDEKFFGGRQIKADITQEVSKQLISRFKYITETPS